MFTDYVSLVYETLSFTEPKTGSQIYTEIEELWDSQGKKGFFGGKKTPSLYGIYAALETLEKEGFAEKEATRPHSQKAPRLKWRKRRAGRRS
jgi:DNA-binding PadR family transcriptional regulator